jgi:hypothetical protein
MGNNLKRPVMVFWAAGEACPRGRSHFDISISVDGYASSASPHTPIAQSETATFANGWLTKMIKAPVALTAIAP